MRGCKGARVAPLLVGIMMFVSVIAAGAQEWTGDFTGPRDSRLPTESVGPVSFVLDSGLFYTAEGGPLVEIYVQAAYDQLSFVKEAGGYVSRVEIVAVFQNVSGDQVGGDSWSREIWVEDYGETIDPWTTYRAQARFALPPGEYSLRLSCGGSDSGLKGEAYRILDVKERPGRGLVLSDVRLGVCTSEGDSTAAVGVFPTGTRSNESAFVPSAGRTFGVETGIACALAEVYSLDGVFGDTLVAALEVLDEEGEVVWDDEKSVERATPVTKLTFDVPIDSLTWGAYNLAIKVASGEAEAMKARFFLVDESRVDVAMDLELLMDLMSIVATEEELQTLAELPISERKDYLDDLWRSRDPDPSTPRNEFKIRFFKRLKEAKLKFDEPGAEGWQTDRGKVYVRNGPPDRIETRPGVSGSMSPYATFEIWYYDATNARYVFEDFGGSGTYTLVDVVQG